MKILYVSTRSDAIGGSNVHIRDLSVALEATGHEVYVLGGQEGAFARDVRDHGIAYTPLEHMVREVAPTSDMRAIGELRGHIKRIKPTLISLHTAKAGAVGRLAALGLGLPVVYTPHGWTFAPGIPATSAALYAAVERTLAPLANVIVNVCESDRTLALSRHVGSPLRNMTIHNGMPDVDTEFMAEPGKVPPRIVMVARFEEQKDHATLFHALARCRDLAWSLDLVGMGPRETEARQLVANLGISDRVRFLGQRLDVAAILAEAQLFVLTSRWEGFPRSILEAMRAGLPVIASRVGGVHEAVEDGVTGWVVPVAGVDVVARRLRECLSDARLRVAMGRSARARFESTFTFEAMFGKTIKLYEQLHASRGTSGAA